MPPWIYIINMIQSKHSREFNSSEEASKRQKLSKNFGIFVSDIPNKVSLKTIIVLMKL